MTGPEASHPKQTIGLLFVHGIGQQKPFDHLRDSVLHLAELMARPDTCTVTVVDRTPTWTLPVGAVTADGIAPITMTVTTWHKPTGKVSAVRVFECHEVYWADLGARGGMLDVITFWFWGLGQWAAPIYRVGDASRFDSTPATADKLPPQMVLPDNGKTAPARQVGVRLGLLLAGLAALLTLVSWTLLKRVAAAVLKIDASPTLIEQYVGDVRTYEERARPDDSNLVDPAMPRRVSIRRRMVTQMVAMGARCLSDKPDRFSCWHILAHSQGTVVAFNGLGELGHTLPNYLAREQWDRLPHTLTNHALTRRRSDDEIPLMMPARPPWLDKHAVIDRQALFRKLGSFITYGSPLAKFAAIWPRIVVTADDQKNPQGEKVPAFAGTTRWINLHAPLDPVAGSLTKAFEPICTKKLMPELTSVRTPFWQPYLLCHLDYLDNEEVFASDQAIDQRTKLAGWLRHGSYDPGKTSRFQSVLDFLGSIIAGLVITSVLGLLAYGLFSVAIHSIIHVTPGLEKAGLGHSPMLFVNLAFGIMLVAGLVRWVSESRFNYLVSTLDGYTAGHAGCESIYPQRTFHNWWLSLAIFGAILMVLHGCELNPLYTVIRSAGEFALMAWAIIQNGSSVLDAQPEAKHPVANFCLTLLAAACLLVLFACLVREIASALTTSGALPLLHHYLPQVEEVLAAVAPNFPLDKTGVVAGTTFFLDLAVCAGLTCICAKAEKFSGKTASIVTMLAVSIWLLAERCIAMGCHPFGAIIGAIVVVVLVQGIATAVSSRVNPPGAPGTKANPTLACP